jgi:Domain of unknown function (DUF2019)
MSELDFVGMSTVHLVDAYADLSQKQGDSLERFEMAEVRKLFNRRMEIKKVLRARGLEAGRALIPLLKHKDAQVRLNAAEDLMAIVPRQARAALEDIAAHGPSQQKGAAGMYLLQFDEGAFKPT